MKRIALVLAFAAFGLASSAQAAPIYFTASATLPGGLSTLDAERALFQAAAVGAGVSLSQEGFETPFGATTSPISFPTGGPAAFTVSEPVGVQSFSQLNGNSLITTEGSSVLGFVTDNPSVLTLAFASPISALGIDITSIDFASTHVSFSNELGATLNDFAASGFASATFFGIVSDTPFTTATFAFTGSELINFDQVQFGAAAAAPVPEPASLTLLGIGLAGAWRARRRRSAV